MATLYDIISELRRQHPTPSASKTLDLVVLELGQTRDNLNQALERLEDRAIPSGGKELLSELASRAHREGLDDLRLPLSRDELRDSYESVDGSQVGIALLLGASGLVIAALGVAVFVAGVDKILHP